MGPLRYLWHDRRQRDTFLLLAKHTFDKVSGVVLLVVLSRFLSAGDIGVYFFAVSFAESFIVLASFGLNIVMMRRVAADPTQASAHLSPLLGFRLLSSPLYLLCVTVAAIALTDGIWRVIVVVALFTLLENISYSFIGFFVALKKIVYNVCIEVSVQVFFLIFFLLGMWWAPSLDVLLEANLLRSLLLLGLIVFVAHRWLRPLQVSWDNSFIKAGLPLLIITFLAMFSGKVNTLILGFLTDYDTVGHYNLAFRFVFASSIVPTSVSQVLFPQLAAHGLSEENRRTLFRVAGFLVGLSLLCMGVVFLFATPLTTVLYGSLADAVSPLLRPMTLLFPLSFLIIFLSSALLALHQEKKILVVSATGTGINVLASYALIPPFGAYGAVFARVFSSVFRLGTFIWYFWRLSAQSVPLAAHRHGSSAQHRLHTSEGKVPDLY